jgi:hypothetical protein
MHPVLELLCKTVEDIGVLLDHSGHFVENVLANSYPLLDRESPVGKKITILSCRPITKKAGLL